MAKNYNKSIDVGNRIKFEGDVNINTVLEVIGSQLTALQEQFGIDCFSGVNFYFNMKKDNDYVVLVDNRNINVRLVSQQVEKTNNHLSTELNDKGEKLFKFIKEIDFEGLKEIIEDSKNEKLEGYTAFYYKEWDRELRKAELEREKIQKELREKEEAIRRLRNEKRMEEERKKKKLENDFLDFCYKHFNKTAEEMKKSMSSYNFTDNERTIKGYGLDETKYKFVYRITLKDEKTGKAGTAYIFDKDYNLINTIKKEST